MDSTIVLASGNPGKLREFTALLRPEGWTIRRQSDYSTPEADECGLSFIENAIIKARNASLHTHLPSIADDSGLEVDALTGAPGIYSARYAGPDANDSDNRKKLLDELVTIEPQFRGARFRCVIVFLRHGSDPAPVVCEGQWRGYIANTESGDNGFGYDSVFVPEGCNCTAAELTAEEKNQISHRRLALDCMKAKLREIGILPSDLNTENHQ
ncbi:MAG: RdgB/HAM1 family non-canonical purine NTP pyrophosphatase [Pseudomonadota bacterium]